MGLIRPIFQAKTYRHLVYLALAFPLGLTYFIFLVTGISVGFGLIIVWVGVPILFGMLLAWRGIGTFERGLHRALLNTDIPEPTTALLGEGRLWDRIKALLRDGTTWRTLAWLFIRFPAGIASFVILVTLGSVAAVFLASPLIIPLDLTRWNINVQDDFIRIGDWVPTEVDLWWLVPVGIILFIAFFHVVNGLAAIFRVTGAALLGPSLRERTAVLETRATEAETRTRLAHELHDSIGHAVTLMVVQAGAGRKVFDTDPGFAKESLEIIEKTGRTSLGELDRVLSILREDGAAAIEPPAPDLDDLDALVGRVREADIPVALSISGAVRDVPREVQRAAYRVVQEALTNVMRHAQSATTVRVEALPASLEIEVANAPSSNASGRATGDGRGILGMRERVAAYRGASEIGPTLEGGYRVWVRFPL
jgi:signal transduction histidine kinase